MFMESCARIIYMEVWNILQATMLLKTFYFSLNYLSNLCLFLTWNIFRLIKWENFICEYDNRTKEYSVIYVTCERSYLKKDWFTSLFWQPWATRTETRFLKKKKLEGKVTEWNEMKSVWGEKKSFGIFHPFWNHFHLSLFIRYLFIFIFAFF